MRSRVAAAAARRDVASYLRLTSLSHSLESHSNEYHGGKIRSTTRAHRDWSLWRDFAVRSSGFPVEGLDAFGPDEDVRLAAVARDPAFREAVAWQNREALAKPSTSSRRARRQPVAPAPLDRRHRQLLAALLLQERHDRLLRAARLGTDSASATEVRSGALERERVVHFETWAIEAVAAAAGLSTPLPMGAVPRARRASGTPASTG